MYWMKRWVASVAFTILVSLLVESVHYLPDGIMSGVCGIPVMKYIAMCFQHSLWLKLRERRLAQQKQQEEAVLRDARSIAEEMKSLEKRLNEAEAAVVEYVAKVAEKAKQQIEAELKHEHEIQKRILQEQEEKFKKTMESSFAEIEARAAAEEASKKESTK